MNAADDESLALLRGRIDAADDQLIALLAERATAVREVWALKTRLGLASYDSGRETEIRERLLTRAKSMGLDPVAVEAVLATIVGKRLLAPEG